MTVQFVLRIPRSLPLKRMAAPASKAAALKLTPCQVCGDLGHRARECPVLEEEEDQVEELVPEMQVDQGYNDLTRKQAPSRRIARTIRRPQAEIEPIEMPSTTDWEVLQGLTTEEVAMIQKKRAKAMATKSKKDNQRALTGEQADFPSLGGHEHGLRDGFEDAGAPMEETPMAAASQVSGGSHPGSSLEAQPTLAGTSPLEGSGSDLGSLWSSSPTPEREGHPPPDVTREKQLHLQRGMVQSIKRGVARGLLRGRRLSSVSEMEERFVIVEICGQFDEGGQI